MKDNLFQSGAPVSGPNLAETPGQLKRALYLWERQPPSEQKRIETSRLTDAGFSDAQEQAVDASFTRPPRPSSDEISEALSDEWLRNLACRLAAIERVIPGDRRLDPPRFSLMMLNAFLGRAVTDGTNLARLPGLDAIRGRIEAELSDLEFDYPAALEQQIEDQTALPLQIRNEIQAIFTDIKSTQKAQQRQVLSSLTALHSAISELRSQMNDQKSDEKKKQDVQRPKISMPVNDLASPIFDKDRMSDPRPILAAARAAAARSIADDAARASYRETEKRESQPKQNDRPYRTIFLGSAVLGLFLILFGREALQFIAATPLASGAALSP